MAPAHDRLVFHGSVARRIVDEAEEIRTGGAGGRFLAVTGTAQSGRSTLLRTLADGFEQAGWRVIARDVRDGVLAAPRADGLRRAGWAIQAAKVVGAGLQVAGGPVGSLLALAAEVATTGHMAVAERDGLTPDDEYLAVDRLTVAWEQAASSAPLAVLIDDADELDQSGVWWDVLFGAHLPDLVADLPLVCVISAERSSVARGSHAWTVLDALLAGGVAEEVRLGPLDRAAVTDALGAVEPNLADQLLALAQRRPGWVAGLWKAWSDEALVVRRSGRWEFGTDGYARARTTAVHRWVETSLRASLPDRSRYDRAVEILELGALEGPHFTAEVVAAMLSTDVEDLIDWLDDNLAAPEESDGASVLVEDGFVARQGGEPLCRYRFRSLLAAGALREKVLRSTNGSALAGRYAKTLAGAYRWSAPGEAATAIVRLAAHAGDTELVDETWARASRLAGVAEAARLGAFLAKRLERAARSTDELLVRLERLNEINALIGGRWDAEETAQLCIAALGAARKLVAMEERTAFGRSSEFVSLLVDALFHAGHAATQDGNWEKGAILFREAAERSADTTRRLRTANMFCLAGDAQIRVAMAAGHDISEGLNSLQAALELVHGDTNPDAHEICSETHAALARALCRPPSTGVEAARHLVPSVDALTGLELTTRSRSLGVSSILGGAGHVAEARGDHARAERFVEAQLRTQVDSANRIVLLLRLARLRRSRQASAEAASAACQALRLAQERGRLSESWALRALARSAAQLELPSAADFVLLTRNRRPSTMRNSDLTEGDGDRLVELDEQARSRVEAEYARDRGAALVCEAFGIEMSDVDRANEQLGRAGPAELQGYLSMVAEYATQVIAAEEPGTTA